MIPATLLSINTFLISRVSGLLNNTHGTSINRVDKITQYNSKYSITKLLTKNSSLIKYFAFVTLGSSLSSIDAEKMQGVVSMKNRQPYRL